MTFTQVQGGPSLAGTAGTINLTLPAASTAGTLLVAVLSSANGSSAFTGPANWVRANPVASGTSIRSEIWYLLPANNPGGVSSFTFTNAGNIPKGSVSEYSVLAGLTIAVDAVSASTTGTTEVSYPVSASPVSTNGDLAVCHFASTWSVAPTVGTASWTRPSGWTADNTIATTSQNWATYHKDNVAAGALSVTGTFVTTTGTETAWVANLVTFSVTGEADAAAAADALSVAGAVTLADAAGSAENTPVILPDVAAAADAVTVSTAIAGAEKAGAADAFAVGGSGQPKDAAGAADSFSVVGIDAIAFTPAAASPTFTGEQAVEYIPGQQPLPPASPGFIASQMPRLYLQDLLTGQWINREVQGITAPQVTWPLNAAGTCTVTLSPPTPGMLDATGNPLPKVWQTAGYLEEGDEIRWGGILTSANPQGPSLPLTFTEFCGYPNGMIYEGPSVSKTNYDGLDAVRYLWAWLQAQTGGNLGLVLDQVKAGVLLGASQTYSLTTTLARSANPGDRSVRVVPVPPTGAVQWTPKSKVQVGSETHTIVPPVDGQALTIYLAEAITSYQPLGSLVGLIQPAAPFTLDWWNSTDCGQEISSIQQEAPFDFREVHAWADPSKQAVTHRLAIGVPRLGKRSDQRFAEGENIIVPSQVTQDGSVFANNVIATGAGSGSSVVRATAAVADGRIRRTQIYTDQTITRTDRVMTRAQKVLAAVQQMDTVTQIIVINHKNAPFGSFGPGDDIPVQLASGWRKALIWSRILSMQQAPTTNQMTLTLARSDSFTYLPQSGSGGSI